MDASVHSIPFDSSEGVPQTGKCFDSSGSERNHKVPMYHQLNKLTLHLCDEAINVSCKNVSREYPLSSMNSERLAQLSGRDSFSCI